MFIASVGRMLLLSLVVGISFTSVNADPVTITGGSARFTTAGGFYFLGFFIEGPNVHLSGNGDVTGQGPSARFCQPCLPGQSVSVGGNGDITHMDWTGPAFATINGIGFSNFPPIQISAQAFFTGGFVTIPTISDPTITLTAPFVMTGTVTVRELSNVVFSVPFQGSGIATLTLVQNFEGTGYNFRRVDYAFSTPEPGSVVLLFTALTGAAVSLRRRFLK